MSNCEIIILGCGGSGGVPLATGYWGNCNPDNPKNRRTRSSIAIRTERTCVVIDSGPDFHAQTITHSINNIDSIIYTHDHADHINGIDDVRYLAIKQRIAGESDYIFPIYADHPTLDAIENRFDYIFNASKDGLYIPLLEKNYISDNYDQISIGDICFKPFEQIHGSGRSLGFIINNKVAYSTDVSNFDRAVLESLNGIDTWIVDCGQFGSVTENLTVHPNIERVMEWNEIVKAKKLYLTHLTPRDDYNVLNNATEDYIEAAYDGLVIDATM